MLMCVTHWRVVFELWCADVYSFSRSSCVTLRPPLLQGSSLTPTLSRHFCPPTSVSVCEGPEAFLLPHMLVWRFHKLYARAASSCQHSDCLAPLFRGLTAAPHHEPSGVQPYAGGVSHGFQTQLVSSWTSSTTAERPLPSQALETCHPCDAREDQAKDSPTKKKPCLLGLTESSSQHNPLPHKPPSGRTTRLTPSLLHPSHAPSDWASTKETLCGASSVTCREQF